MDYLEELKAKIRMSHGCESTHRQTVSVKEVFQGEVVWDGDVEVFDLIDHAKAKRCFAWGYPNKRNPYRLDAVAVLESPRVVSPETAVRAAIAVQSESRINR